MDNKQRKRVLSSIYRTITFFSIVALGLVLYLAIDKLNSQTNNIQWLDITLISVAGVLVLYILRDSFATRRMKNKYKLAKFYYFIFFMSIVALITLSVYCYYTKFDVMSYLSYILPIALVFGTELVLIINFLIGLTLVKLYKNTTITLDSSSETPNFNDEILMKKKLDELNRKLQMKKLQEEIDNAEKELDK